MAALSSAVQLVAVVVVVAKAGQARQRAQGASLVPLEPPARLLVPSVAVGGDGRTPASASPRAVVVLGLPEANR